jgi:hypothetical protein
MLTRSPIRSASILRSSGVSAGSSLRQVRFANACAEVPPKIRMQPLPVGTEASSVWRRRGLPPACKGCAWAA